MWYFKVSTRDARGGYRDAAAGREIENVTDGAEKETRTRGRTRREPATRLTATLSVLLTEQQRDALYEEARAFGYASASEYVRKCKLRLDDAGGTGVR